MVVKKVLPFCYPLSCQDKLKIKLTIHLIFTLFCALISEAFEKK